MLSIDSKHVIYAFSPDLKAVASVPSGSLVEFHTADALGGQIQSEADTLDSLDFSKVNPATGPLSVEGAEPGDVLRVDILEIKTAQQGVVLAVPGLGVLGDQVTQPQTALVSIGETFVEFRPGIRLPKRPMIGVIGVATKEESVPCGTPGDHGGNMDTTEIAPGNTLFLPIFQPGAMLALGDVHAVMGDGEICGTGVECPATVVVRVSVLKGWSLHRPMLETKDEVQTIASADSVSNASVQAVQDMIRHIQRLSNLSFNEAYMLLSLSGNMKISQLVDPLLTARMALRKEIFGTISDK